ncbi:MAG: hypothetical protein V4676_06860 [Bacteroidota bacterium]
MPRQTFLAKESFVDASEKQTKECVLSLPAYIATLSLVNENKLLHSFKFCYDQEEKKARYNIDVSILPLNDQYTRISLHASHTNGHSFYNDSSLSLALHDFESAIHAAVKGDMALYMPLAPRQKKQTFLELCLQTCKTAFGILILKKKWS